MENEFGISAKQVVTVFAGERTRVFHVEMWNVIDGHLILHHSKFNETVFKRWDDFSVQPR